MVDRMDKYEHAKMTKLINKERRKNLVVRCFEVKVQDNKLSRETKEKLGRLFLEVKWLYNHFLSNMDKLKETKICEVTIL